MNSHLHKTGQPSHTEQTSVLGPWVVVVVRTRCGRDVFIHITARMHLIGVAEHLGVRLPASPPPRALDNEELFVIEG